MLSRCDGLRSHFQRRKGINLNFNVCVGGSEAGALSPAKSAADEVLLY